ncbi:hypothetical protein [uncultured Duncaniella sp.]|uniref:hypothetical protein n=1 Tax=uncultured Duncaniella sp. TaxID=2768039 RepID=UPI002666E04A|nr:hypothetical protein [uncultured Duncaniella sp.]
MDSWTLWSQDISKFIITIDQDTGLDIIFDTNTARYYVSPFDCRAQDQYLNINDVNEIVSRHRDELNKLTDILDKDPKGVLRYDSDNALRNLYESRIKELEAYIKYYTQALKFIQKEECAFKQRQEDAKKLSDETILEIHKILADCNIEISDKWRGMDNTQEVPLYIVHPACEWEELTSKFELLKEKLQKRLTDVDMNLQEDGNLVLFYKEGV